MDRQEAWVQLKTYLRGYVESVTQKSKGANMYVCPICGSGSGRNGTGAFSIKDGTSWKCFSCNAGGDIFDLYGAINGTEDRNAQLEGVCQLYGITLDRYRKSSAYEDFQPAYQNHTKTEQHTHSSIHTNTYTQEETGGAESFKDFFLQAHSHIAETDYPQRRGLSQETIDRFKLGYIAEWRHPKASPRTPATPRLIIPITEYSYLARDTRAEVPAEQRDYTKSKVKGAEKVSWTFNRTALRTAQKPIFIVEGELDALSIIDVGGEAVALGSIAYVRAFLELLKNTRPTQPLVIALDNEKEPSKQQQIEKAVKELSEGLEQLKLPYYRLNPAGQYKDANEALQKNRDALREAVAEAERIQGAEEQARKESYLKTSTAHYLQQFIDGISNSVNTPYIPTGFPKLDSTLDGGLYEGLYVVGAISSLGKTTLVSQIADQIAQSGQDVLIFSLEMARTEIMSKSISRHTLQSVLATGGDIRNAKTARGITTGTRYIDYNQTELGLITQALTDYSEYAEHIYIVEGEGNVGATQIWETVQAHKDYTGNTPVVVVDYVQILAPYSERATDKQNMDKAVLELKRLSRYFKTPVIGISSLNRANYSTPISMEALKESGGLEYGSDVIMGLQLKGTGGKNFDVNEAKRKDPREIELVVLKNRNGRTGDKIEFSYYPMFNFFMET